ncbi:DUF4386 domain-containing protein [Aquimarina sp. 2201CG1-2-11]|uniref:DUF4386 domain-containing protein n=1 Tax=Aquimarina discodermiae TaxID=3231043 RepID=UPI00346294F7
MNSIKKNARIAGLFFLIVVCCGMFAEMFVRQKLIIYNTPETTWDNILSSKMLFSLGAISDLLMSTAYFLFVMMLYPLLKQIHKNYARIMVLSVIISVAILCVNMLNQLAVLLITEDVDYLNAFTLEQRQALVLLFMNLHTKGYFIAQIFYGLYLFPLGYLVYKSNMFPKTIGILLMLGCIGDFVDFFRYFLFPDHPSIILQYATLPANLGEFSLCLWLLVMGVRKQQ